MGRALVVSLHDVSPHTREVCQRVLSALDLPVSLLVIPDHHRRGPFVKDAAFCEWLCSRVRSRDEAVIHGYYHQRAARIGEKFADRLITRNYTAGEGEFFDIDHATARELVMSAREEFRSIGVQPCGFIAPAWLLSAEGERAIRELGLRYTTRMRTVADLANRREWRSQSLCWSVRARWRGVVSIAWNAHLFHRLETAPLMRIAIHPSDISHPRVWQQITRCIAVARSTRTAMTYEQWMA